MPASCLLQLEFVKLQLDELLGHPPPVSSIDGIRNRRASQASGRFHFTPATDWSKTIRVLPDFEGIPDLGLPVSGMNQTKSRMFLVGLLLTLTSPAISGSPEPPTDSAPLDLAPFGYLFRPNAPADRKPTRNQVADKWHNERVGRSDVGRASTGAGASKSNSPGEAPDASQLSLEVTTSTPTEKQDNRPTWWTRTYEPFPGLGARTADNHKIVYETSRNAIIERLDQYPKGFRYEADPQGLLFVDKVRLRHLGAGSTPSVVGLRVLGVSRVVPIRLEVEWGFQPKPQVDRLEGQYHRL